MKKIMIFSNNYNSTMGYTKIAKQLAKALIKDYDVLYLGAEGNKEEFIDNGIKVLKQSSSIGTVEYIDDIVSSMQEHEPDVFFIIGDAIIRQCANKLHLIKLNNCSCIQVFYTFLDTQNVPDGCSEILKQSHHIIASSDYTAEQLIYSGFTPKSIIYPGCSKSIYKQRDKIRLRKKYNIPEKAFMIFNYARVNPRKNLNNLLEASVLIARHKPNTYFYFHWLDYHNRRDFNSDDILKRVLKFRGDNIKINNAPLTEKQIAELISCSDCCISPNKGEGFNFMILESLYSEVPLIVSDNTTAKELCKDYAMLIKCDVKDWVGFSCKQQWPSARRIFSAINKMIINHRKYKAKAKAFRRRDYYSWTIFRKRMKAMIDDITKLKTDRRIEKWMKK